jgi:hypothetical protein
MTKRPSHDYASDPIGARCLELARESKAQVGFGAVVVRNGKIVGQGRNRRSEPGENARLGGDVDYAAHAEQAALLSALDGLKSLEGCEVFVLGEVRRGTDAGKLSVRKSDRERFFTCLRCARSLARFGVPVNIPLPSGWHRLTPELALETANTFRAAGRKRVFSACVTA